MKFEVLIGYDSVDEFLKKYPAFKNYNLEVGESEDDVWETFFITINSLDDLIQLSKSVGYNISISEDKTLFVCDGYCDN